jgi:hypothetical protein
LNVPEGDGEYIPRNPPFSFCKLLNDDLFMLKIDVNKYGYEMVWLCVFLIAFVVFFTGKSKNSNIAIAWKNSCKDIIT